MSYALLVVVSCICPSAAVAHACGSQHVQPLDGLMAVHKCMLHVSLGHCRNVFRFYIPLSFTSLLMSLHLCLPDPTQCKPDTVVKCSFCTSLVQVGSMHPGCNVTQVLNGSQLQELHLVCLTVNVKNRDNHCLIDL